MGKDGGRGVVDMAKALNYSLDLIEWKKLDGVKEIPFHEEPKQVI